MYIFKFYTYISSDPAHAIGRRTAALACAAAPMPARPPPPPPPPPPSPPLTGLLDFYYRTYRRTVRRKANLEEPDEEKARKKPKCAHTIFLKLAENVLQLILDTSEFFQIF